MEFSITFSSISCYSSPIQQCCSRYEIQQRAILVQAETRGDSLSTVVWRGVCFLNSLYKSDASQKRKKKKKILFASHQGWVSGIAIPNPSAELLPQAETKSRRSLLFWFLGRCWAVRWWAAALLWTFAGLFQVSCWGSGLAAGLLICLPAVLAVATKDGARGWWWKV